MTWTNFAGDQTCTPFATARPGSVEALTAVVKDAATAGRTVRVVGAGHSFTPVVPTDGTLVTLDDLRGLQRVDAEQRLVTVAAGTRLFELNGLLDGHGLAMPNLGDIDRQSIAGAISTATHGTGAKLGNLATQVESLELVLADGSVRTVDGGDELAAARVSVGALGVISAVTLRTVPAFTLHGVDVRRPLDETLERLDELRRRQRPLRVLRVPARRRRVEPDQQLHRRPAAARRAASPAGRTASCRTPCWTGCAASGAAGRGRSRGSTGW